MAASPFQRAMEEVFALSQKLAALFILGVALNMAPQMALKPSGTCAEHLFGDYNLVVYLTVFLLFSDFCAGAMSSHVKRRVPDGAGLQGVATARARALLRLNAALAWVLSVAASGLAVSSSTYLLLAKTGAWECQPAGVRSGLYASYVVIVYILGTVYGHALKDILMAY